MRTPIKKCSCCNKISSIVYQDWAKDFRLNLCPNCAIEQGFNFDKTKMVTCMICRKFFIPFRMENVCWACKNKKKLEGGVKKW